MCGIFGLIDLKGHLDAAKFGLPNATDVLKHRGPDDWGYFLESPVYLGHRRLSIIDLATGKQPIFNEDGSICIVFNGEIYNFHEIRQELTSRGHIFKTNSDTETIVHAYEEWDAACVDRFRGMFGFAIWDRKKRKLFAARDRLGIKPFFYASHDGVFYFGSEMKAILQYPSFPCEMDHDALAAYFTLGYIPAPWTIYRHIRKLPPGHLLELTGGEVKIRSFWDLEFRPDRSRNEGYFIDGFMGLLEEAVKLRLISDVPLGAFLSGGIDSGTVVALMSRHSSGPVNTCCMGFGGDVGGYLDERSYAREVASRYGCDHREYVVEPDPHGILEEIVRSFDEPFADHSTIPSYYLCKVTREKVTVALSGLGGDEAFGGYERYLGFKLSTSYSRIPGFIREKVLRSLIEQIPERADGHYTVNHLKRFVRSAGKPEDLRYLGFISMGNDDGLFSDVNSFRRGYENVRDLVLGFFNAGNSREPMDRVFYCDIKTYLPEDILACTDRMSMRHALEVRVPFIDHKLLEFCATIPNEMKIRFLEKKHILRKAVSDLLPSTIFKHRKQGFVGPMTKWLRTDLKDLILSRLRKDSLKKHGILNPTAVQRVLQEHFNRKEINDKLIWSMVMFQTWYDLYIDSHNATGPS
jgi:asparagine synthase (glutamine-hydrolysing)